MGKRYKDHTENVTELKYDSMKSKTIVYIALFSILRCSLIVLSSKENLIYQNSIIFAYQSILIFSIDIYNNSEFVISTDTYIISLTGLFLCIFFW